MTAVAEHIKRMMGWCPNTSGIEIRRTVLFDDLMVSASDTDGELSHFASRWWNKYHNRILLYSSIFTLLAISFFISDGRNRLDIFMIGIISGLVFSLFFGVTEWRRLNKAAAGEFRRLQVTRRKMLVNYLVIIGFIFITIFIMTYFAVKTGSNIRDIHAFVLGFILIAWTQFFEVVYWEWKNKKILIVEKASFYAVDNLKHEEANEFD